MKKIKCTSCGGDMTIDENKEYAICKYCNTKYKLNEDINLNIKIDEDLKNTINSGISSVKKGAKYLLIPIIIFSVISIFIVFNVFRFITIQIKEINDTSEIENSRKKFDVNSFNNTLEMYNGTQSAFFVEQLLDEIVTSNKKNKDHQITVIYKENSTTIPDEIVKIKQSLDNYKYEVSFDYDNDGYIYKTTIELN